MATHSQSILLTCVLYLLQFNTVCHSFRQPINRQSEIPAPKTSENIPDAWSFIGTLENVTYWQETSTLDQSRARTNCDGFGRQLIRPRNREHLDFLIFENGLDGSWTDGITFYTRELYQPSVHSTMSIVNYGNLALRINAANRNLQADVAGALRPSVCSVEVIPYKKSLVEKMTGIQEEKSIDKMGAITPNAVTYLGSYGGYQYYQESTALTQTQANTNCESLGLHLATFVTKSHLDFISVQGALNKSWTAYAANKSRELYKWGNGAAIAADIPIVQYPTNLGLVIGTASGNHRLEAEMENVAHPSICMLHVG